MSRCSVCDHSCKLVLGNGPRPSKVLFIGEKPDAFAANVGKPLIGDIGKEFDATYLPLAKLSREDVRVTNALKCRLGGNNNKPKDEDVLACAKHWLPDEIDRCEPEVIVLMSAATCRLIPKIELDKDHGIPVFVESTDSNALGGYRGWVVPMYSPASAMHDTAMMIPLLEDFYRLGRFLRGKYEHPIGSKVVDYQVAHEADVISDFKNTNIIALDTEDDGDKPWSIQYSTKPGMGRLVFMDDYEALTQLKRLLPEKEVVLHYSLHDIDALRKMGININRFRDTMQEAYHLGNLPQGLKALAWRLLGIRMQSWEDVVLPHSRKLMVEWLTNAYDDASDHKIRVETQLKTKVKVTFKRSQLETDLHRILKHSVKPDYDIWDKSKEIGLSGYPIKSIANVPIEDAVFYACQDADVTGQVALWMEHKRREIVSVSGEWEVFEGDEDQ